MKYVRQRGERAGSEALRGVGKQESLKGAQEYSAYRESLEQIELRFHGRRCSEDSARIAGRTVGLQKAIRSRSKETGSKSQHSHWSEIDGSGSSIPRSLWIAYRWKRNGQ